MTSALRRVAVRTPGPARMVEAEAVMIGRDVLVYVFGGEKPHIGAVAAAQPRPSLSDPHKLSATASVLTFPAHKEDVVVKFVAEALAARLATNVVVTAGIHWDDMRPEDIDDVVAGCRGLVDQLERALKTEGGA